MRTSAPNNLEARFLSGRHSFFQEIVGYLQVFREFFVGFRTFHNLGPSIVVFGSARFNEGHFYYELGRRIGGAVASDGYAVVTGGGPGLMEAANRGAKERGGISVGCHIRLAHEYTPNRYLDRLARFSFFFVRKSILLKYAYAFVILPGGIGTLDELTEAVTLIQTGKLYDFPVILVGRDYWRGFLDWMENTVEKSGAIDRSLLSSIHCVDTVEEVMVIIRKIATGLGLKLQPLAQSAE